MTSEQQPPEVVRASVPERGGDITARWSWVARPPWTDRMLVALERGSREDVWFSLIDKVFSEPTLRAAATRVIANRGAAGVDHVSVEQFEHDLEANVTSLSAAIRTGEYRPSAVRRVNIPKPGSHQTRPLGIPTVRDRVVQGAVRLVLEPIFEKEFAEHSYGFRPRRGCKDALRRVSDLLKTGHLHVVDADLQSYFDTIPHELLMAGVRDRVVDGRVLALVESFLQAGIFDGLREWTPDAGAPQGAVLSPLLSNIYLNPLDHLMARGGWEMVRYADDFVIACRSAEEAQRALEAVQRWAAQAGLTLHPTKTRIVDVRTAGFDFLGYHFKSARDGHIRRFPRKKSLAKLKDSLRAKTRRTDGRSMACVITDVNRTLRGWYEYFRHSSATAFHALDAWVRMRLRAILRKRLGLTGGARCLNAHVRWNNAYFAKLGLFDLTMARASVHQPRFG